MTTAVQSRPASSNPAAGTINLAISGMNCGNCARHVTEAIQSVTGVHSAVVSLDSQRASVRPKAEASLDVAAVIRAVEAAGYGATVTEARASGHHDRTSSGWRMHWWIGVICTIPLMAGEWIFHWGAAPWFQWASLVLAGIVQFTAGLQFYRGAWSQLKIGSSNMDTLVALGSTTAFGYSIGALFAGHSGHLYFMEAAAIITVVSIGHWMEARISARASSAVRELLDLAPLTATRRNPDGSEITVPVAELKPDDQVTLRPGDRVPADGDVIEGNSAVNEAMLTGESAPADKKSGAQLYAGTVNLDGRLLMRIRGVGERTALAHIIASVQRAQTSRADIQRLGDRVSSVFVPIVVVIAVASGLWWGFAPDSARHVHDWLAPFLWPAMPAHGLAAAFIIAAAVLIVACPCAMGLATPAAIMASSNAAARRGILIRDGIALEKTGGITAVVFDKTGTLTTGKLEVTDVWSNPDSKSGDRSGQLSLAAALASHSRHPVSQAVARLSTAHAEVGNWTEIAGAGVQAVRTENGRREIVKLGSIRWLKESGANLSPGNDFIQLHAADGAGTVGLLIGNSLTALFAIRDTLKPGARHAIQELEQRGLKVFLVTGDNAATAAAIAGQAGIPPEQVRSEVRPEQKAEFISNLQEQGERVAFVGDGINDAPALEQADLGIAVSRASDVAREAADIILLNSEIEAVPEAISLARATLRTIKQNLFWAFFYNAIGIPLAALGFMSPILCAAAMGMSDLVVIGNALRLARWGRKRDA